MFKQILANPVTPVPPVVLATLKKWLNFDGEEEMVIEVVNESNYIPITGVNIDTRFLNNDNRRGDNRGNDDVRDSINLERVIHEAFLPIDGKHYQGLSLVASAYDAGTRVFIIAAKYRQYLASLPDEVFQHSAFIVVEQSEYAYEQIAKHFIELLGGFRIAVTGSAGKTATKEMLAAVLGSTHPVTGKSFGVYANFKNENNLIGVPKNVFQLQKNLLINNNSNQFSQGQVHILIFELGMSAPGEISRLAKIVAPHLALITNILHSHIGNFSHRDDIAHAKGEVIHYLESYTHSLPLQVDQHTTSPPMLFLPHNIYAKDLLIEKAHASPQPVELREVNTALSTSLELVEKDHSIYLETSVSFPADLTLSNENRKNTKVITKTIRGVHVFLAEIFALSAAVGEVLGFNPSVLMGEEVFTKIFYADEENTQVLQKAESRLQVISPESKNAPLIIDDSYNSNPDSLVKILTQFIDFYRRNSTKIRLIFVLGDILELGEFEGELYEKLTEEINHSLKLVSSDKGRDLRFFFLGTGIKICYDNLNFESKYYFQIEKYEGSSEEGGLTNTGSNKFQNFVFQLHSICNSNTIVFFKASHGLQFQTLVSDFIRTFK